MGIHPAILLMVQDVGPEHDLKGPAKGQECEMDGAECMAA